MPGLMGWVYSRPLEPATAGGDLHFLSVCNQGALSRVAVGDVMGHGQAVSSVADDLRELMHKHINTWDQSNFMRELNNAFHKRGEEYATVGVLGFNRQDSQVVFTNAWAPAPALVPRSRKKVGFIGGEYPLRRGESGRPASGADPGH